MVDNPEEWFEELKEKGFKKVLFHYESVRNFENISRIFFEIKNKRMEPWIVFNPETSFQEAVRVASEIYGFEGIMFMGVRPGMEGQEIEVNIYRKIINFKRAFPKVKVQIDGGVNLESIEKLKDAGADIVNTGSFVSNAKNPKEALEILRKKFS